jgi:hypothetical protein
MNDINDNLAKQAQQILHFCGMVRYVCLNNEASRLSMLLKTRGVMAASIKNFNYRKKITQRFKKCDTVIAEFSSENLKAATAHFVRSLGNFAPPNVIAIVRFDEPGSDRHHIEQQCNDSFLRGKFHRHPLSAFTPDQSEQYLILAFVRLPVRIRALNLKNRAQVIPTDLLRNDNARCRSVSMLICELCNHIPEQISVVVAGEFSGSAACLIAHKKPLKRILEIHTDRSSFDYFNLSYPKMSLYKPLSRILTFKQVKIGFDFFVLFIDRLTEIEKKENVLLLDKLQTAGKLGIFINIREFYSKGSIREDWNRFAAFLSRFMLQIDVCWGYPSGFKARTEKIPTPIPSSAAKKLLDYERIMLVAIKIPMLTHPEEDRIARSLIFEGFRIRTPSLLKKHALSVLKSSAPLSISEGAALCVLTYLHIRESRITDIQHKISHPVRRKIMAFLQNNTPENKHILRWLISLSYAFAIYHHEAGRYNRAKKYFTQCTSYDASKVESQIFSKPILSHINLAKYSLGRRDFAKAKSHFKVGLSLANAALKGEWYTHPALDEPPNRFGIAEIGDLAILASKCANGLNMIELHKASPGEAWAIIEGSN